MVEVYGKNLGLFAWDEIFSAIELEIEILPCNMP